MPTSTASGAPFQTPTGRQPLQFYKDRLGVDTVFLPVPWRKKGPRFTGWQKTKWADTQDPTYQRDCETDNLGVLMGPPSDHLASIDFDEQRPWDLFEALNPWTANTFRSKGVRPGNVWFRLKGEYPAGKRDLLWRASPTAKAPVEWRAGGCTMLAGLHEDGMTYYTVVNDVPVIELRYEQINWPAELMKPDESKAPEPPYDPKGGSPIDYIRRGIRNDDILLGDGYLERGCAVLVAGLSGIGKSTIGMQMACSWSAGAPAFDFYPPRILRVVLVQNEDSDNDVVRQSAVANHLGVDPMLIHKNCHIETVRGKLGGDAVKIFQDLVVWFKADILLLNPLSAYHDGDISSNADNVAFLYGAMGELLHGTRIGLVGLHHKTKPLRLHGKNNNTDGMYDILGGSVTTNFFRDILNVNQIGMSEVFKFTVTKRFKESRWPLRTMMWQWDADPAKRLWIPASVAAASAAQAKASKTLDDLRKLVPVTGSIPKATLEMEAMRSGMVRAEFRGLLARALDESTPDPNRLFQWSVYNPHGFAKAEISRFKQPENETHQKVRERIQKERRAASRAAARTRKKATRKRQNP